MLPTPSLAQHIAHILKHTGQCRTKCTVPMNVPEIRPEDWETLGVFGSVSLTLQQDGSSSSLMAH